MTPHRWFARLPDVPIIWQRPHPRTPSGVDRTGNLWVDPRLSRAELRCALAHETVHLERGHVGCQPPAVELDVREQAARSLIPIDDLVAHARWAHSIQELAAELDVIVQVLEDRIRTLTQGERERLSEVDPPTP